MTEDVLYFSPAHLENHSLQVLIVGSGPAGVAVAEYLYSQCDESITIGILERGGVLATTHISNLLQNDPIRFRQYSPFSASIVPPLDMRAEFIKAHGQFLWDGDLHDGGMMII